MKERSAVDTTSPVNFERAALVMSRHGIDGLVATSTENFTYLTDYFDLTPRPTRRARFFAVLPKSHSDGIGMVCPRINLVYGAQHTLLFSDVRSYGRYNYEITEGAPLAHEEERLIALRNRSQEEDDPFVVLVHLLDDRGLTRPGTRLGIDEMMLTHDDWRVLGRMLPGVELVDAYDIFREIRMIKTPNEIDRMRKALAATIVAMQSTIAVISEGAQYRNIWRQLRKSLFEQGLLPPWNIGIGMGPSGAFAFPDESSWIVRRGDVVRFDLGGTMNGYVTDFGRTGFVGEPSPRHKAYYEAVLAGQQAGCKAVKPGVRACDIYRVVRSATQAAGIPHYYRPSTGHGIGREIYDSPSINETDTTPLEAGMIINVEAPYYELGFGGVQVEDSLLVTDNGWEYLVDYPRDLFIC